MDARGYGVLIGVASMTLNSNCPHGDWKCILDEKCDKDGIAVFTKVEAYLPWIKETTGQGYCYAVISTPPPNHVKNCYKKINTGLTIHLSQM